MKIRTLKKDKKKLHKLLEHEYNLIAKIPQKNIFSRLRNSFQITALMLKYTQITIKLSRLNK